MVNILFMVPDSLNEKKVINQHAKYLILTPDIYIYFFLIVFNLIIIIYKWQWCFFITVYSNPLIQNKFSFVGICYIPAGDSTI